jgi:hypothetical protein
MSTWRRIALEIFPEHNFQNSRDYFSVYMILFELLPLVRNAHESHDEDLLQRIYKYAEWCWTQKGKSSETYNAVCVAFYEHLVDEKVTCEAIPIRIKPQIFKDLQTLFKSRMKLNDYQILLLRYNSVNQTDFN